MALHVLGISRSGELSRFQGMGPAQSRCGPIGWIVEEPLAAATIWSDAAAWGPIQHARLLEAIHRQIDILPARFAAVWPDEPAGRDFLRRQKDDLAAEWQRLAGTVELGARLELSPNPEPAVPPVPAGGSAGACLPAQYMAARRCAVRPQRPPGRAGPTGDAGLCPGGGGSAL